jgi:ribosomal protein S27AE
VNVSYTLPLDHDGFLRRQCPNCLQYFKWHHGPANEEAEGQQAVSAYFCPRCGTQAVADQWFTVEQVAYIQEVVTPKAVQSIDDGLSSAFKGMNSKHFKVKKTGHLPVPEAPEELVEPDDMTIVASPCHGWEPVKVPDDAATPLYCLICGQAFAV